MKLPIRRKVLFLTLGLSLALVMASVFISYTIFSRQIQRETLSKVEEATWNLSEEAGRRYDDFLVKYFKQGLAIYEESREEIEEMSALGQDEFADKRTFFKTLTAELFPPEQGFGMSYEKVEFNNNYRQLLGQMSLVSASNNLSGGTVYFYDEEHGNIVYLMDTASESAPYYHFPLSTEKAGEDLRAHLAKSEEPESYFEENACISIVRLTVSAEQGEATVYIDFRTSTEALFQTQRSFVRTSGLIMLSASLLISLVYLLFVDRYVARPLIRVTRAAAAFTDNLAEDKTLQPISAGVLQRDELGDLSERMDLMQEKIVEYVSSLAEKTKQEESMKAELSIASRIQREALPESGFASPGVHLDSVLKPAREVGGDLYDYFLTDADHLFFVIADVSGKGIPASLFMMRGKEVIKASAKQGLRPGEIAKAVNEELFRNNEEGLFITAFFGIYEFSTRRLCYARAGHEQPFLLRAGKAEKISEESNIVLGLFDGMDFAEDSLRMETGDKLLLYTDGLNEGINLADEEFGYDRIRGILEQDPPDMLSALQNGLQTFAGGAEQFDDVTLLLLSVQETERFSYKNPDYNVITDLTDTLEKRLRDLDPEGVAQIGMMTDEMVNNIVSYAFEGIKEPELSVMFARNGDTVRLSFIDNGTAFNPLEKTDPDTEISPLDRPEGGLGIYFVRQFSDAVSYRREGRKNYFTLVKKMKRL